MLTHGITDRQARGLFGLFLAVHLVMWTLLPGLTRHELDSDSMMHFAWGQEWMGSYNLHPPLLPWIVAGFLQTFGVNNWNYVLLSQINICVAFTAIWVLARQFFRPAQALAAVCLLEFVPYYSFLGIRLNHTSLLISLWAVGTLFAYLAVQRQRLVYWVLLGLFMALAMLTKYYAVTLVGAIGAWILFTPRGRGSFRSPGPYVAVVVFLAVLYPHADYVLSQNVATIRHAGDYFFPASLMARWAPIKFFLAQVTYAVPAVLVFLIATRSSFVRHRIRAALRTPELPEGAGVAYMVMLFPLLATALPGLVLGVEVSSRWGGPILITAGLVLALQYPVNLTSVQCGRIALWALGYAVIVPASMLLVIAQGAVEPRYSFPGRELAEEVTALWHKTEGRPLRLVGGGLMTVDSIAYHSPDHPSTLQHLSYRWSPWVTEDDVRKHGMAVVCLEDDELCIANTRAMFPGLSLKPLFIEGRDYGLSSARSQRFLVLLVPPDTIDIRAGDVTHNPMR